MSVAVLAVVLWGAVAPAPAPVCAPDLTDPLLVPLQAALQRGADPPFADSVELAWPTREGPAQRLGPVQRSVLRAPRTERLDATRALEQWAAYRRSFAFERASLRFVSGASDDMVVALELSGREPAGGLRTDHVELHVGFAGERIARFIATQIVRLRAPRALYEDATGAWLASQPPGSGADGRPGVAVADLDHDGFDDVLAWDARGRGRLLHNQGGRGFVDISEQAGVGLTDVSAAALPDLNNDGITDLVLGHRRSHSELFFGDGRRFFPAELNRFARLPTDVTALALADLDRDGLLEIYFATAAPDFHDHLAALVERIERGQPYSPAALGISEGRFAQLAEALPMALQAHAAGRFDAQEFRFGPPDVLLVNAGAGLFGERTAAAGLELYRDTVGATFGDLDGDHLPDLVLAQAAAPAAAYAQAPGSAFVDASARWGVDRVTGAAGVTALDVDADRDLDLALGAVLLRNQGGRSSSSSSFSEEPGGSLLLDADGDGSAELVTSACGRVTLLPGREDVSYLSGLDALAATARADLDRDGFEDLVVASREAPHLRVLLNRSGPASGNDFIAVTLTGAAGARTEQPTKSNRDAVGATVSVRCGRTTFERTVTMGEGAGVVSSPTLSFGLGRCPRIDALTVRFPSGREQRFPRPAGRRSYRLVEGGTLVP